MSSVQLQVLAQVLARAGVAGPRNRFNLGQETVQSADFQPSNTYALTTAPSSPYTRFYDAASIHASGPAVAPWNCCGGSPAVHAGSGSISGVLLDVVTTDLSTTPHTLGAQNGFFDFVVDGVDFVVKFEQNHDFRLFVEDADGIMKLATTGLGASMQTGTGWAYYTYAFNTGGTPTFKHRRVRLQPLIKNPDTTSAPFFDVGVFGGIYVKDASQVFAPRNDPLRVFVMHDSHGQGRNGPSGDGIWSVCFAQMGLETALWNGSIGGTGAIDRPWPMGYYSDRQADIDRCNPDIYVMPLSWNDYDTGHVNGWTNPSGSANPGMAGIVDAMRDMIDYVKGNNPDAIIIVPGLMDTHEYLTVEPDAVDLNTATAAMIAAKNDGSIRFIDLNAMFESPWTGVTDSDNGGVPTGSYDMMYGVPPDHPLPYGDYAWGTALANRILEDLEALNKVTVGDYIPPPVTWGNWTHVVYENDTPNTFTVTASSGVAYRFGNATANQWSDPTLLAPGTYTANYTTWPTDPSPGNVKEVQIGTPV